MTHRWLGRPWRASFDSCPNAAWCRAERDPDKAVGTHHTAAGGQRQRFHDTRKRDVIDERRRGDVERTHGHGRSASRNRTRVSTLLPAMRTASGGLTGSARARPANAAMRAGRSPTATTASIDPATVDSTIARTDPSSS